MDGQVGRLYFCDGPLSEGTEDWHNTSVDLTEGTLLVTANTVENLCSMDQRFVSPCLTPQA